MRRDDFRNAVFERDKVCVNCGNPYQDAHHLIERRLWLEGGLEGGYLLDNGVALCGDCHLLAESTAITPQELRDKAGIKKILLPEHFDDECEYDKWGNIEWPNGTRTPGPLFNDESVQKIIKPYLDLFVHYYKHPRTAHLPWSPNGGSDEDKVKDVFKDLVDAYISDDPGPIAVTLKMDGEQATFYHDYYHARSIESGYSTDRTWVANLHGKIKHEIPEGWRIVGENLYAQHSIAYKDLPSYFMVYAIFDDENNCLDWDLTEFWCEYLGLIPVPLLYRGKYDRPMLEEFWPESEWGEVEGYVVRSAFQFHYSEWDFHVGKVVRKDHVKTDQHWRHKPVKRNGLL